MRRRTVYLILALSTVAGACSSDKKAAPSTSVSSASSATATSTTVPATTTTTTAPPPSIPAQPAGSPLDATNELIRAWKAGDHDAAAAVAVATVVDTLFAADPGSVQSRGCNQPPPDTPVLCVYRTGAGELQLRSSPVAGGWIVDQAMLTEGD